MSAESRISGGILRGLHRWHGTSVPLAVAVILGYTLGVPMARAAQGVDHGAPLPVNLQDLEFLGSGSPSYEGMVPVEGALDDMQPMPNGLASPPEDSAVSQERRNEVMAQARAEQAYFRKSGGGFRAVNRKGLLQLDYGKQGMLFSPHDPSALLTVTGAAASPLWKVRMATESFVIDGLDFSITSPAEPKASGERVALGLTDVCEEWVVNRSEGFEHGYTVGLPPLWPDQPSDLEMVISIETALEVVMEGGDLRFSDADGRTRMEYSGLKVFDAEGRELDSAMVLRENGEHHELRLEADVSGAVFPVVVDPVVSASVESLMAMGAASGDEYGAASDGCGEVVAIAAPGKGSGEVFVYHENQGGPGEWDEVTSLTIPAAEDPVAGDRFGESVAVFKDQDGGQTYIAVGAPEHGENGAVFVFCRNEGGADNWGFIQKLTVDALIEAEASPSAGDAERLLVGACFGKCVDGENGGLVSGAPYVLAGLVFYFVLVGGLFALQQTIRAPAQFNPITGDLFGIAVAIAVGILVIGSSGADSGRGRAYLLQLVVATGLFSVLFQLFSDKSEIGAAFGAVVAVALLGTMIAIGSPRDIVKEIGPTALLNAGSVFIYAFTLLAGWNFLTALFGFEEGGLFGSALVFDFLFNLVVGAPGALTRIGLIAGAAFFFLFNPYLNRFDAPTRITPDDDVFVDLATAIGTSLVLIGTMVMMGGVGYNLNQGVVFRMVILPVVLTFALWLAGIYSQQQLTENPVLSDPDGDPEGDGIPQLNEFGSGTDPRVNDTADRVCWIQDGNCYMPYRQGLATVNVVLTLLYALSPFVWFATGNGPLAGQFQFQLVNRGVGANEYVVIIPLLFAIALFLSVEARSG